VSDAAPAGFDDAERLRRLAAALAGAATEVAELGGVSPVSQAELLEALGVAEAAAHRLLAEILRRFGSH